MLKKCIFIYRQIDNLLKYHILEIFKGFSSFLTKKNNLKVNNVQTLIVLKISNIYFSYVD